MSKIAAPASPKSAAAKPAAQKRTAVTLTGKQRQHLRGLAHRLQPVLQIGKAGPSKALLDELDRAVETHELVKIRVLRECPTDLDAIVAQVEKALGVGFVGSIGNVAVIFRKRSKEPTIVLPGEEKAAKAAKSGKSGKSGEATRSSKAKKSGRLGDSDESGKSGKSLRPTKTPRSTKFFAAPTRTPTTTNPIRSARATKSATRTRRSPGHR